MKTVDEIMLLADAYADCGRASPFAVGYKAERDTTRAALVRAVSELVGLGDTIDQAERVDPMDAVAIEYAHRMALELECVLADRNANWDRAMNLIGEYRSAMDAIHEQHSPTFMGEPVVSAARGEYQKSFAEVHPANPNATCKCEHWQSCPDCHPTAHVLQNPAELVRYGTTEQRVEVAP